MMRRNRSDLRACRFLSAKYQKSGSHRASFPREVRQKRPKNGPYVSVLAPIENTFIFFQATNGTSNPPKMGFPYG